MKLILAFVAAVMLAAPSRAADSAAAPKAPAKSGWSEFFKNLKTTLSQSAVSGERKKGKSATSVAAVRGDDQTKKNIADPNEPGLRGDAKSAKIKKETALDKELSIPVDQLAEGKVEEALKGLEAFKAAHPKHRIDDVDKAIEGAKAMLAEKNGAPAAEKP